jgi:hypothetical protein
MATCGTLQVIAGIGRHIHYCETSLLNMFGMPAVEAFLNIVLATRKVLLPRCLGVSAAAHMQPCSCGLPACVRMHEFSSIQHASCPQLMRSISRTHVLQVLHEQVP